MRENYRQVRERIAQAAARSGRRGEDVLMVAVTKSATPDQIRTLVELGQGDLGESKVQQLTQRVGQLDEFLGRRRTLAGAVPRSAHDAADQVRWHMVGHLQRNKVKQVLPLVSLIHSVDSLRLAEEIHAIAAREDVVTDILIQVNASGEQSKFGVASPAVIHLAEQIDTMIHLRLRGLMTMAPTPAPEAAAQGVAGDPDEARSTFARTAELFHDLKAEKIGGDDLTVLSMGMSGDFEIAIEEGANLVRIGRALFGEPEEQ